MSRGAGKWQRYILEVIEKVEPNAIIPITHFYLDSDTRSNRESIRRAAHQLAAKGQIQVGEWITEHVVNGKKVNRIGLAVTAKESDPIPARAKSYRERAVELGMSHNTVKKIMTELGMV